MTGKTCAAIICASFVVLSFSTGSMGVSYGAQDLTAKAQEAAAKASPELVGMLSKEIGGTPAQSAGAAGALFGLAKSRLKPEEFSQVSKAVPGMASLLKAAPAAAAVMGTSGSMAQLAGAAGGLASMGSAFSKLGLKPEMVAKAIPVLTSFVGKTGGANVAGLLAGVLK